MSSSMARPSSWWNIGTCVASGVSGRYTRPGHHDVDRRRLRLHRPHLHRRGVRAQQHLIGEVEGVLRRPRRMLGRMVQRGEVVVLVLDLRALDDREAEPDEDVLHLAPDLRDQVKAAGRLRRVARQGHVDPVLGQAAVELRGLELGGALAEQLLERHPHLVRGLARPARAGPAAARRSSAASRSARTCGRGSARAAPRARRCPRLPRMAASASLRSWSRSAIGGHPICHLVERHARRHRHVQRVGVHRDRTASSPCRQLAPLRPQHQHHRSRHAHVTQLSLARSHRGRACGRRAASSVARAGGRSKIDPIDARTAFGEYGSAQPGPSTTVASASACAERMIVPTLPGSSTPWR